jgi:thiamine biosynthesis protein ThiI
MCVVHDPDEGQVVIDIRAPSSTLETGVCDTRVPVLCIPYYELAARFASLEMDSTYLLYCESGVMSRIQAAHLRAHGHSNVGVFEPELA